MRINPQTRQLIQLAFIAGILFNITVLPFFYFKFTSKAAPTPTLSITRDATSITTDDGTRRIVSSNADVAFGKKLYHTSINNGNTNLILSDDGCGAGLAQLVGFWECQTAAIFELLEATPTRASVNSEQSPTEMGVRWFTYPDGRSYVEMLRAVTFLNIANQKNPTDPQFRALDAVNWTMTLSDTTNDNYAGTSVIPYRMTDLAGPANWATGHPTGEGWWKSHDGFTTGLMLFDLSEFRANADQTTRSLNDYRNPDDLTDGLTVGSAWFSDDEYTASPSDYFNEHEGTYNLQVSNNRVSFELDGQAINRVRPVFKLRRWRSLNDPALLSVGGVDKENGTDFNADIIPFTESWFYDSSDNHYTLIGDAGLISSFNEYLYDIENNYTIPFLGNETGDYIAFGSPHQFSGVNLAFVEAGAGDSPQLAWEYWNGSSWAAIPSVQETKEGARHMTAAGAVFWTEELAGWSPLQLNAGRRNLFYVRARLTSGDYGISQPTEEKIATDIMITQYFGNVTADNTTITISEDSSPPVITLTSVIDPTNDSNPEILGIAEDEVATVASVEYQIDGTEGSWSDCEAVDGEYNEATEEFSCSVNPSLSEGSHTIYLRATDVNGQTTDPADYVNSTFVVDIQLPITNATEVSFAGLSAEGWTKNQPTATWVSAEDNPGGSGLAGYCLALDEVDEGMSSLLDPAITSGILTDFDDGVALGACPFVVEGETFDFSAVAGLTFTVGKQYNLSLKAVDQAGNVYSGEVSEYQDLAFFKYDNVPPNNPDYISLPGDFIATKNATITWPTVGDGAPWDGASGVAGLQYRIGADAPWYGDNHNGAQDMTDLLENDGAYTTFSDIDFALIQEGANTIYVRTWDNAGNVSTNYVTGVLKVNSTAPSAPQNLVVDPSDNQVNSYAFSWEVPGTFLGQAAKIDYCYAINRLPSTSTCTHTNPGQTTLAADAFATQPGVNTFYLVARDEAGNINYEAYASVSFSYSGSAPGMVRNLDVSDISIKASSSWKLALAWDEPEDTGAGVSSYKIFRSASAGSCSETPTKFSEIGSTAGSSFVDAGLNQQNYYYCLKACDSANNCSAYSSTVTGYPDGRYTTPATLQSGPSVADVTTRKARISWTTNRTSDSKIAFGTTSEEYYDEEPSNSSQVIDHVINLNNLTPGTTYYYLAKWTDEDGNTGTAEEKSFTTKPPPTIASVQESDVGLSSAIVNFTVKDAAKVAILYGKTSEYGNSSVINTALSESSYSVKLNELTDGTTYHYKLRLYDEDGQEYDFEDHQFTTLPRPKIANVRIQQVRGTAQSTILVSWQSNTEISSIATFYPEDNPNEALDEVSVALKTDHKLLIQGLAPRTPYVLTISGRDKVGNEAFSAAHRFTTAIDSRPPMISDFTVEGANVPPVGSTGQQTNTQFIVTWNTDEPSTSQVEFGEGSGAEYPFKTQDDLNLKTNHLVVISGLTPSKVYHLRAISKDRAGNMSYSVDAVTITPKNTENALNLIFTNLQEAFGFLGSLKVE